MYSQIAANKRRSWILLVGFVLFVGGIGWLMSQVLGRPGLFYPVLIFALVYALISYYASAKIALMMSGAKPIQKKDAPELYRLVENLSITAGLPMPKVYIIDDPSPNAFATGRDPKHAVVAVTTGIMERLEDEELEGVLAHEMSHVGNYDIRFMAIVVVLVSLITILSDMLLRISFWGGGGDDDDPPVSPLLIVLGIVGALLAPLAATLIQLAISRRREYLADASGALLTRYPEGLARALAKIAQDPRPLHNANSATAPLYISNPLKTHGIGSGIAKLFSTHPPIEDRIRKLKEMEDKV